MENKEREELEAQLTVAEVAYNTAIANFNATNAKGPSALVEAWRVEWRESAARVTFYRTELAALKK